MARSAPATDVRTWLNDRFRKLEERVRTLETPMGDQVYNALAKVRELIADLPAQVAAATTAFLSSGFTTGSMNATGNVAVGGSIGVTGEGTFVAGVNSLDVYNRNVTGSGSFHNVYANVLGQLGQVPSSQRFKQDITPAQLPDAEALFDLSLRWFRYIDAVENLGDDAPEQLGLIAEEVDALGLNWLVEYDAEGLPFSINRDRLLMAVLAMVQMERSERLGAIQ